MSLPQHLQELAKKINENLGKKEVKGMLGYKIEEITSDEIFGDKK